MNDNHPHSAASTDLTYYSHPRREVMAFLPDEFRTLLDVGCGGGDFGALVKQQRQAEVWGVDVSELAATLARGKLDHVLHATFDEKLEIPTGYFDVITFNDSLEHFPDPYPPLALCRKLLRPGGVIVCCLPNVRYFEHVKHFLVDMDWKYEDAGILDHTHLRFFTRKSILRTFDLAGYDVMSINGIKPHYWSGKRIFLLRLFFDRWMQDMKYLNYVTVARPR